jgi:hypothetical protein
MSALPRINLEKIKLSSNILDEFCHEDFHDSSTVRIAFRLLGSRKKEHYLNKYAAQFTRVRGEQKPAGCMTHAEILICIRPGVYVKSSVIKKRWSGKDPNTGKDLFTEMGAFLTRTDPREWGKYVFLTIHAKRDAIFTTLKFLAAQNDAKFNHRARCMHMHASV